LGGVRGRAEDRDAVAAVDQTLCDVQQRGDVAGWRQRGDEDFWHALDARRLPVLELGGFVEIRWRLQAMDASVVDQPPRGEGEPGTGESGGLGQLNAEGLSDLFESAGAGCVVGIGELRGRGEGGGGR